MGIRNAPTALRRRLRQPPPTLTSGCRRVARRLGCTGWLSPQTASRRGRPLPTAALSRPPTTCAWATPRCLHALGTAAPPPHVTPVHELPVSRRRPTTHFPPLPKLRLLASRVRPLHRTTPLSLLHAHAPERCAPADCVRCRRGVWCSSSACRLSWPSVAARGGRARERVRHAAVLTAPCPYRAVARVRRIRLIKVRSRLFCCEHALLLCYDVARGGGAGLHRRGERHVAGSRLRG